MTYQEPFWGLWLRCDEWADGTIAVCYAAERFYPRPSDCLWIVPGTLPLEA